jgi:hypothetical protein
VIYKDVIRIGNWIFLAYNHNKLELITMYVRFRLLVTTNIPSSPILVTLIMEAIHYSETSVLTKSTQCNIPEDGILHLKSLLQQALRLDLHWDQLALELT